MGTVYSTLFGRGVVSDTANHIVYTVPAGSVAVLRDVSLFQYAGAPASINVHTQDGVVLALAMPASVPALEVSQGRVVLNAGDSMEIQATAGNWTYALSGYLLTS